MRTLKIATLTVLLVPSAAAAAVGTNGLSGTFKGKTSQGRPVLIRLGQGAVRAPSSLSWSAPCGQLTLSGTARLAGHLNADGSFSPRPAHTVVSSGGTKLKVTTRVRFKVAGRVVRGTFTAAADAYSSSGAQVQRCVSPKVTFTARR